MWGTSIIPAFLDVKCFIQNNYSIVEGTVLNESIKVDRGDEQTVDLKTVEDEIISLTIYTDEVQNGEYLTVKYLPSTKYGYIIENGEKEYSKEISGGETIENELIRPELLIKVFYIIIGTSLLNVIVFFLDKRSKKKTRKTRLVVFPNMLIITCNISAGIFLLMVIYFIYRGYSKDNLMVGIFFILMNILSIIFTRWKIIIFDNYIQITPMLGRKKKILFSDINDVRKKSSGSLVIISKKRKVGIEYQCTGYSNIYSILQQQGFLNSGFNNLDHYCEQEEINTQPNSTKALTKLRLYIKSIKNIVVIMGIVGITTLIFGIIFLGKNGWNDILSAIWIGLCGGLFVIGFGVVICLPISLKGIILINRQEKIFGFHFNDEMKKYNICSESCMNNNWFIDVELSRVFAFHRKYIVKINKIKKSDSGISIGVWEVTVTDINNKKFKIFSSEHTLRNLKEWHQRI